MPVLTGTLCGSLSWSIQEYMLYVSIHMKFKNRTKQSTVLEIRIAITWWVGGYWLKSGMRDFLGGWKCSGFCFLWWLQRYIQLSIFIKWTSKLCACYINYASVSKMFLRRKWILRSPSVQQSRILWLIRDVCHGHWGGWDMSTQISHICYSFA